MCRGIIARYAFSRMCIAARRSGRGWCWGSITAGPARASPFASRAARREATLAYLRERELVTSVYLEKNLTVEFSEGVHVSALTYVVDRAHPQYAGRLPVDEITRLVSGARGAFGDNPAYVRNTYEHLLRQGIHDEELATVTRSLDAVSCRVEGCGRRSSLRLTLQLQRGAPKSAS